MILSATRLSVRAYFGFATLALILGISVLLLLAPPDGVERAQLLQFVGRFHPLSVHLPIAALFLVALFELAGRSHHFRQLRGSVDFLLCVALCGAIFAALLGWCLSRGGGYSGALMTQHMWGAVSVAAASWICWLLRGQIEVARFARLYVFALIATLGLVSFTGYRGGQLSQGENHLTQFMPTPLRTMLGLSDPLTEAASSASADTKTFYGARIQPLFAGHCVTCHGQNKHKAGLRLDSFQAAMRGSKRGVVIKAGDPKSSELFHRITLPPTDDDFMPAEHKRPLSTDEVRLIETWIASGASGTQPVDAVKTDALAPANLAPADRASVAEIDFEEIDPGAVEKERAAQAPIVAQIQKRIPNILAYRSRTSADVVITASWLGSKFGDDEMKALGPISDRIVAADFSNTAITDRSAAALAGMKNLRQLRLMHTNLTDATIQALGSLEQLESLSVFDTRVTASSLPALARLPKLRHVYVGNTRITASNDMPSVIRDKIVF